MNKQTLLIALAFAQSACLLQAQSPPVSPFLSEMKPNAQWRIDVQGVADKPKASKPQTGPPQDPPVEHPAPVPSQVDRSLARADVTRTKDLFRRINTWSNGTKTEKWWQGQYCLLKEPSYDTIFIFPWSSMILSEEAYELFSNTDFPELAWVGAATFLEWATIDETPVAIYGLKQSESEKFNERGSENMLKVIEERTGQKPPTPDPEANKQTSRSGYARLAWIDGRTKRPMAMESGRMRKTYTFTEGDIPPIELPPGFREAIGRHLEAANVQKTTEMRKPKL